MSSRKRISRLELRFELNAPEGAGRAQKRAAVMRAIFEGKLPDGFSWKSERPISIRNPDTKHGKYADWQAESVSKASPTLMRVFHYAYRMMGGKVSEKQEKMIHAPMRPAKISRKRRSKAAKKWHRGVKRREKRLTKRQRAVLHGKRVRAAKRGWITRRKNRKGKGRK